jgi:excisionase family DNA binding protein
MELEDKDWTTNVRWMQASLDRDSARPILVLRVREVMDVLSLSRSKVYAMIASQELDSIRIGRSVRVPYDGLLDWMARHRNGNSG